MITTTDYAQLSLFAETTSEVTDPCKFCYVFRRDAEYGIDTTKVHKTQAFNLPVRQYRAGEYKGLSS